jgi:hypothetical protein
MPRFRIAWPRCSAMSCTSAGVFVCASTRGDGCFPIRLDSRDTRPPSSSVLMASGSGPADATTLASGAPIIDRSVQLPDHDAADVVRVDDGLGVRRVLHADHQQLRQLVPRRHLGQHSRACTARRLRGAWQRAVQRSVGRTVGRRSGGLFGGGRAGQQ